MRSLKLRIYLGGRKPIGGYSLQAGGEDQAQDEVISGMDHHLVLILAEVLGRITLTGVAIKGQNCELLRKFIFQHDLRERRVGYIDGDDFESIVM